MPLFTKRNAAKFGRRGALAAKRGKKRITRERRPGTEYLGGQDTKRDTLSDVKQFIKEGYRRVHYRKTRGQRGYDIYGEAPRR